ncbi:MAG: pyridoxal kinase PdxY [Spirochaetaceae bacterium]|jgi:pyridoxine kinase|nr:pyridoxal kinase PdxY [Spirochaetaceae bacterium]
MAILSIQSHVVYGYAGNTSAVFPLQRLGHEVWAINTVEFSNHTGYGAWRGKALGADLVNELVDGLGERGVLPECEAVLSGYLGEADIANAIKRAVRKVREVTPTAVYCCDPVMGDYGRGIYVKPGILEMFRDELFPLASIVTPNQFELGLLTGIEFSGGQDKAEVDKARKALDAVHKKGVKVVLVTSFGQKAAYSGEIGMLVSDGNGIWRVRTPEFDFDRGIAGSGDLTTAVFLARYLEAKDARLALEQTANSVFGIMETMYKSGRRELCTITSQNELVSPARHFEAEHL